MGAGASAVQVAPADDRAILRNTAQQKFHSEVVPSKQVSDFLSFFFFFLSTDQDLSNVVLYRCSSPLPDVCRLNWRAWSVLTQSGAFALLSENIESCITQANVFLFFPFFFFSSDSNVERYHYEG